MKSSFLVSLLPILLSISSSSSLFTSISASLTPSSSLPSVHSRSLISTSISPSSILSHHSSPSASLTSTKSFSSSSLLYITPWNRHGYEVAQVFACKWNYISPVWFQVRIVQTDEAGKKMRVDVRGMHDVDGEWVKRVRETALEGQKESSSCVVPHIVPRFLVEVTSHDHFLKLASSAALQSAVISKVKGVVEEYELDGVVLEMVEAWPIVEHYKPKLRKKLNRFVANFADQIKASSSSSSSSHSFILVVRPYSPRSTYFQHLDFVSIYKHLDGFSLMTYDFSSGSTRPGANAPLEWMKEATNQLMGREKWKEVEEEMKGKVLMGLNLYGMKWEVEEKKEEEGGKEGKRPDAIVGHEYVKLIEENEGGVELKWDARTQEHITLVKAEKGEHKEKELVISFPTLKSLAVRLDAARELGTGISMWEGGQGLDYFYDLF